MKNIDKKVNSLISIINGCSPREFIKYRFHDFTQEMVLDNVIEEPRYFQDPVYQDVQESMDVFNFSLSFEVESADGFEGDTLEDFVETVYGNDDFKFYFYLGIYVFKCYVNHCCAVATTCKNNMKNFCKHMQEDYFGKMFYNRIMEYHNFCKEDPKLEDSQIELVHKTFSFFDDLEKIDLIIYQSMNLSEDELQDYIEIAYNYYASALQLCFANFLNYLNGIIIIGEMK